MTIKEFNAKHHLNFNNDELEEALFFTALDKIYLEHTPEQAIAIIKDFMIYADDIFNEIQERIQTNLNKIKNIVNSQIDSDQKFDA